MLTNMKVGRKKYLVGNFIEIYKNVLSDNLCDSLVKEFEYLDIPAGGGGGASPPPPPPDEPEPQPEPEEEA